MNIDIGKTYSNDTLVSIDASKHINIEGMSGMGKSTLLARLFVEHVRAGGGGLFIDPHGDTADEIATMIPKDRMWDFVWFDPEAHRVPPFNPLYYRDPSDLERGKESFFTTVKSLAGPAWGDESARVLWGALDAVCAQFPNPTPMHLYRFVADDKFRESILEKSEDPLLKMFREQYDKLGDPQQMAKFSPIINKLGKFLRHSMMPIVGQPDSLDFLDIMNQRRIMVCRLSKGRLGEETAQILGSLIVSMVSIAALRRENQAIRPPFMLIADETHNFTHGGRFGSLLAESRKYGISLVTALQGGYQVPFLKDLFSNCPTKITFNVSGLDAQSIADDWKYREMRDELTPEMITALPRYEMFCRRFENDEPTVSRVKSFRPLRRRGDEADRDKLIAHSLMRWGKGREKVTRNIMKFLASPVSEPA